MRKKIITVNGSIYKFENKKLLDVTSSDIKEAKKNSYVYIKNYGLRKYDAIIIGENFFWLDGDQFIEVPVIKFAENNDGSYFRTNLQDENNFVFLIKQNQSISLLGRSFNEIDDGLFKIGKQLFQKIGEKLDYIQNCENIELWQGQLEVWSGEVEYSDLYIYRKSGNKWVLRDHFPPMIRR